MQKARPGGRANVMEPRGQVACEELILIYPALIITIVTSSS